MALSDSFLHTLISKHKDDFEKYTVDKVSESVWYLGFTINSNSKKSEPKWLVYKLQNSGTTVDVSSSGNNFKKIWDDRETLSFAELTDLDFTGNYELSTSITIGDTIGVLTPLGGQSPFVYTIESDDLNLFQLSGNILQYKNIPVIGQTPSTSIKVVDSEGSFVEKVFNFTVGSGVVSKSLSFDGINESLTTSYHASLDSSSSSVSMFFRIKVSALANTVNRDFSIMTRDVDGVQDRSFFAYISKGSNKVNFGLQRIAQSHYAHVASTATPVDVWTSYVCVISSSRMAIFVNGAFDSEILVGPANMETPSSNIGIDIGGMFSGKEFEGQISEVALWYETLTDQQAIDATAIGSDIKNIGNPVTYHKLGQTFIDDNGTFKAIDEIGSLDAIATNMTLANIVEDAPA